MAKSNEPDLSEFLEMSKPRRMPCGMVPVLAQLAKPEREQLEAALAARDSITNTAIEKWLTGRGVKLSQFVISRHRRGNCACDG